VLKRSAETFRRSGSSGLVWDDRFFFGDGDEMNKDESGTDGRGDAFREKRTSRSTGFIGSKMECCQSKYNDETCCLSPALELPLPKASKRVLQGIFKKSVSANSAKPSRISSRLPGTL